MPQYRIYVCDRDGQLLTAYPHNGSEREACSQAERVLCEAGPGIDSVEVWLGNKMIKTVTRKPG